MIKLTSKQSGFSADRNAATRKAIKNASINPYGTSFTGKGNITNSELIKLAERIAKAQEKVSW